MRTKITVQFESGLEKEFLKKLVETAFPNINIKEYDLWKVPYCLLPSDMSAKKPVWNLSVKHVNNFDVQSFLNVIKEIEAGDTELEKGFVLIGNNFATLLNSVEPSGCVADRKKTKVEDNICGFDEKNMNKDKVRIAFSLTNNGHWSCEQVKAKILEYIPYSNTEINVTYPNQEFDDFSIDISVDRNWAYHLDFAEFMQWCEFNIIGSRPLVHGFHSESSEEGYKITFETTSAEEYNKVQAFIRGKIIDKDEPIVLFHCNCGCNFSVKEPVFVKALLVYETNCPACHAICRRAIEEV